MYGRESVTFLLFFTTGQVEGLLCLNEYYNYFITLENKRRMSVGAMGCQLSCKI